ncbi:hypothetical protein HHJ69_04520 [Mobiluncus curtisii]|uniref:hypothetical protein n=1 Tax=Mobiluncus curtisii TaxID=2051 RepID=UPI00146FEF51|nr:hypothetical protein [Mobiluncus curtisii]NMW47341.1 hypothetical protein [Mobiluncus curtisii]
MPRFFLIVVERVVKQGISAVSGLAGVSGGLAIVLGWKVRAKSLFCVLWSELIA